MLARVAGVVTELGGSTSHLASLARERGVPMVLGVPDATRRIPDGAPCAVDEINWRKFEGLTAEFFKRLGIHVELSAGRNDDNVDLRLWPEKPSEAAPPLVLVQCKRQKEKVGKVVVKALYADVLHEGAQSGLIVTSTAISPGAEKTSLARGYPIGAVERDALRRWVQAMRTPFSGIFMGT